MWFTGNAANSISSFAPGNVTAVNTYHHWHRSVRGFDKNGVMWASASNGHVLGINLTGAAPGPYTASVLYDVPTGGSPSGVAIGATDGMVYVGSFAAPPNGRLFVINPVTGTLTSTIAGFTAGNPSAVTSTPDGNVWVGEWGSGYVAEVSGGAVTSELHISNTGCEGLAVGGDGSLYAGCDNANVFKVNPLNGVFGGYSNGITGNVVSAAPGSDNSVWLTEWGNAATGNVAKVLLP
jgi:streptogramin lyase